MQQESNKGQKKVIISVVIFISCKYSEILGSIGGRGYLKASDSFSETVKMWKHSLQFFAVCKSANELYRSSNWNKTKNVIFLDPVRIEKADFFQIVKDYKWDESHETRLFNDQNIEYFIL